MTYARPGDTVHISEMVRLVRGSGRILDVLDVLHREQVALRIHDGAFSARDLTARHPRTGDLLSTVKFMVQTLAAAGDLQRDLQCELTYDGLRAAEAKGSEGGRRPALAATKTDTVRTAYLEGRSIAALARDHGAIRTAVADLLPDHTAIEDAPAPELPVTLDMPGKVADFLGAADLEPAGRVVAEGVSRFGVGCFGVCGWWWGFRLAAGLGWVGRYLCVGCGWVGVVGFSPVHWWVRWWARWWKAAAVSLSSRRWRVLARSV
ncbi:hypothetical protein [Streptomyces sp. 4N124]|uniref:hypothetical protein n=1 Tax=Streptomyces sp. 4N124 TaxID=3457420 RepID=UPI003FD41A3F